MTKDTLFTTLYQNPRSDTNIFFESNHSFAMLSVTPATPGHFLLIPKKPVVVLDELMDAEISSFIRDRALAQRALIDEFDSLHLDSFYNGIAVSPPKFIDPVNARCMDNHRFLHEAPADYNIFVNCGPGSGQIIPHYHEHHIPRRLEEQGRGGAVKAATLLVNGENL